MHTVPQNPIVLGLILMVGAGFVLGLDSVAVQAWRQTHSVLGVLVGLGKQPTVFVPVTLVIAVALLAWAKGFVDRLHARSRGRTE